jgi:acyl carrier protein
MSPEQLVAQVFGLHVSQVTDATSNQNIPEWDSLGHVNLIMQVESHYGVSLSTEEALALTNVETLKRTLSELGVVW